MSSIFRRAGAAIAKFFTSPDPTAVAETIQVYSKDSLGKPELFARTDDGTIYQITPPGAAVGSATPYVFVWDPNATLPAGPNIYTVFATLYTALQLVSGFRILQFVNANAANITIPNGTYDFTDVLWQGSAISIAGSPERTNIQVGSLAGPITITGLRNFKDIDVFNNNFTPITDLISGEAIYMENTRFHVNGEPFIRILEDVNASIFMDNGSQIDGGDDAIGAVFVEDNATLNVFMQGEAPPCILAESAIDGTALAALNVSISAAEDLSLTQPDFLGTVTVTNIGNQRETVTQLSVGGIVQVGDSLGYGPRDFGTTLIFKNVASIAVILDPGAGFTIDGSPTYALSGLNATVTLVADGVTNWNVTSGTTTSSTSSTAGSAAATGITWRPGSGETGPIVWDDWTAMYAYIDGLRTAALVSGIFNLILDDQSGPLDIPAGAWDLNRIFPIGVRAGIFGINAVQLDMDDATVITNLASLKDLTVTGSPTDGFGIILSNGGTLHLDNTTLYDPGVSGAVVEVPAGAGATIFLGDDSGLRNTEGQVVVRLIGSTFGGGSVVVVMEGARSTIHSNTISGDGSTSFNVIAAISSAECNLFQAAGGETFTQLIPHWEGVNTDPNGIVTAQQSFLLTNGGTIFINTDGAQAWAPYVVISGGGSPVATPTVERLAASGAVDPDVETTFVSGIGVAMTLADGTVDGFIKEFCVTSGSGTLTPANVTNGDVFTWVLQLAPISTQTARLIWDATLGTWHPLGDPYIMTLT